MLSQESLKTNIDYGRQTVEIIERKEGNSAGGKYDRTFIDLHKPVSSKTLVVRKCVTFGSCQKSCIHCLNELVTSHMVP